MVKVTNSSYLTKRRSYQIQTTIHEGALAVSGEKNITDLGLEDVQQDILEEFKAMNAWVAQRDGIIGHIKGFIASRDKSFMISTTGDEVDYRFLETAAKPFDGIQVSVACIVFNIPQLELEEKLIAIFDRVENGRKALITEE